MHLQVWSTDQGVFPNRSTRIALKNSRSPDRSADYDFLRKHPSLISLKKYYSTDVWRAVSREVQVLNGWSQISNISITFHLHNSFIGLYVLHQLVPSQQILLNKCISAQTPLARTRRFPTSRESVILLDVASFGCGPVQGQIYICRLFHARSFAHIFGVPYETFVACSDLKQDWFTGMDEIATDWSEQDSPSDEVVDEMNF